MDPERQQPPMEDIKTSPEDHQHYDPPPFDGPSAESEEMLPLYSESHARREADGSITAPDKKATPDQVRDFIVELLTSCRGLHVDHARRVAARWTLGNGQEMRAYPPWMYRDIFGFEDGWIVYKEVHVVLHNAGRKRRQQGASMFFPLVHPVPFGAEDTFTVMVANEVASVGFLIFGMLWSATCGIVFALSESDGLTAPISACVGAFGIIVMLGGATACCVGLQSAEAIVEMSLKTSYGKASEPRPM